VGPHRLHVALARRIAAAGVASLRVDLGGIGDSVASSDATSFRESAVADTRVAMTALTAALGAQRFILFGVCSGADNSLATALVDDRVAAIVLVDPHTYPTRRSQLRYLRTRVAERGSARDAARWGLTVAVRRLGQLADRLRRPADPESSSGGRERPPIEVFRSQLTALVDRGVRVLAVYSGIHGAGYNDRDQLFELFPELRGRIDHMYFAGANHTFTELGVQAELIDAVTAWITKRFG
jgi:pimeloyl-ACP methyl ester carboxylesterase